MTKFCCHACSKIMWCLNSHACATQHPDPTSLLCCCRSDLEELCIGSEKRMHPALLAGSAICNCLLSHQGLTSSIPASMLLQLWHVAALRWRQESPNDAFNGSCCHAAADATSSSSSLRARATRGCHQAMTVPCCCRYDMKQLFIEVGRIRG